MVGWVAVGVGWLSYLGLVGLQLVGLVAGVGWVELFGDLFSSVGIQANIC